MSAPVRGITVAYDFGDKPVPKWENGFLVSYDSDSTPAMVYAFDRAGRRAIQASISFPDGARVVLRSVAASAKGLLAVAGFATVANGAIASFIAWVSPAGAVERIVRTSPFAATRVCFGSDGTLWAAGVQKTPDLAAEAPHDVIRRYDPEGRLEGTVLPRATFQSYDSYHPSARAFLVASTDRVGFYTASAREWIEISPSGAILGRWNGIDGGPDFMILGVGVSPSGTVYLSGGRRAGGGQSVPEYYRLDKSSGTWLSVDASDVIGPEKRHLMIAGVDGNHLVVGALSDLFWVPVK